MRKAIIANGIVTNVIEVADDPAFQPDWAINLPDAGDAGPGWTHDGATFTAPVEPVAVPQTVTRFQALAALYQAGKLDAAKSAVAASGGLVQIAWDNAQTFERASPTIAQLATALGMTGADVDALFIAAAAITA